MLRCLCPNGTPLWSIRFLIYEFDNAPKACGVWALTRKLREVVAMRYLRCLALLSLLTWYSMTLSAQVAISGRITGVVTDNTGATIEGATVEGTGTALMHPRSVHTQAGGAY